MADSDSSASTATATGGASTSSPSFALQVAQGQMTQIIGKLASNLSSQSGDQTSGLNAILSAIQAKPSA